MYKSRAISVASRLPTQRPFEIATVVYTAELFGLITAYPSQFNVINTSVAMYGATEFWRCKHPGPCGFNGTSVLHSARCRYAGHESSCSKFSTNSNGKK